MGFYLAVAAFFALALSLVLPTAVWLSAVLLIGGAWAVRKAFKPKPAARPVSQTEFRLEPMRHWVPKPEPECVQQVSNVPQQAWQTTLGIGFSEIDRLVSIGDWDSARAALQRIAYGMPDADPETKAKFTAAMCQFAVRDPLFKSVMLAAQPAITESPGITQAKLYAGMSDEKKELIRYVLYFAAESGQIVRQKKGNSYALYPKGFVPPKALPKPVRKKKSQ